MKKIAFALCILFSTSALGGDWVYEESLTDSQSHESTQPENSQDIPTDTNIYAIQVPSSGFIQNKIMLAALKSGSGSNAVEAIVGVLKGDTPRKIMVMGDNQPLVVATIQASIKEMKGIGSTTTLIYHGEKQYCDEVEAFAQGTGVKVITAVK